MVLKQGTLADSLSSSEFEISYPRFYIGSVCLGLKGHYFCVVVVKNTCILSNAWFVLYIAYLEHPDLMYQRGRAFVLPLLNLILISAMVASELS